MNAKSSNYFEVYDSLKSSEGVPNFQMNRPITPNIIKGELGIELEIEATTRLPRDGDLANLVAPSTRARWVAITDGSLRGESREYIVNVPIFEKEVEHMLYGLFGIFKEHKVVLNNSNRCSTHVHYNMKGALINELTSIIILWGTFEDYFIKMNGEERVSNHFCLPIRSTKGTIKAWDSFLRYGSMDFGRELKYSSLNLLPIFDKGSIEFRCGAAADEADNTFKWIKFLYAFSTYIRKTYNNPFLIAHDMSERGAYRILKAITDTDTKNLGDEYLNKICDGQSENEVNDTCLAAFRDVQSLALGFPWEAWLPLINKEYVPNPFDEAAKKKPPPLRNEIIADAFRIDAVLRGAGQMAERWRVIEEDIDVHVVGRAGEGAPPERAAPLPVRNVGFVSSIAFERLERSLNDDEMLQEIREQYISISFGQNDGLNLAKTVDLLRLLDRVRRNPHLAGETLNGILLYSEMTWFRRYVLDMSTAAIIQSKVDNRVGGGNVSYQGMFGPLTNTNSKVFSDFFKIMYRNMQPRDHRSIYFTLFKHLTFYFGHVHNITEVYDHNAMDFAFSLWTGFLGHTRPSFINFLNNVR